jgi:protein SCO1
MPNVIRTMRRSFLNIFAALLLAWPLYAAESDAIALALPDTAVVDQHGNALRFHADLVKDRIVVVNFIFTSCTTICSPMGANFAALQKSLGDKSDVRLISVSLDPSTDTPARLKSWSERLGAKEGWTLVTGAQQDIDGLLKAFGVYNGDRINHAPLLLVGDGRANRWTRGNGLLAPAKIAGMIDNLRSPDRPAEAGRHADQARSYFGDIVLTDQHGKQVQVYDELFKGRTVVIHSFFATCPGSCPVMAGNFAAIQKRFAERLGKDLVLISITVDPKSDTPAKLLEYAKNMKAQPGWYFLTGSPADVERALRRLGQYVDAKEDHQNVFLVGNLQTGLWKKAFGLAKAEDLVKIVESVLNDRG